MLLKAFLCFLFSVVGWLILTALFGLVLWLFFDLFKSKEQLKRQALDGRVSGRPDKEELKVIKMEVEWWREPTVN